MNPNDPQRPNQPWQPTPQPGQQPVQPMAPPAGQEYPQPPIQQAPVTQPQSGQQYPQQPQALPPQPVQPNQNYGYPQIPEYPQVPASQAPAPFFQPTPPTTIEARQPEADFSFITNPDKPSSKQLLLAGGSKMKRIVVVVGGLTFLVIIGVIIASLVGGSAPDKTAQLTTIAQQQTEVARIAALGSRTASRAAMRGAATSIQLTTLSARSQISSYMTTNGEKLNPKLLALKKDAASDTTLKAAIANNTYDTTFADLITSDLNNYMRSLKTAYDANPGPKGREILKTQYAQAELLVKQTKAASDAAASGI